MDADVGASFARALAAKDREALVGLLAPRVRFRAMTTHRSWEADDAAAVIDDVMLGCWFEPTDTIEALEAVETGTVGDRQRLTYRMRIRTGGQPYVCEQHAFYDIAEGRIGSLWILCSGFQPEHHGDHRAVPTTRL